MMTNSPPTHERARLAVGFAFLFAPLWVPLALAVVSLIG